MTEQIKRKRVWTMARMREKTKNSSLKLTSYSSWFDMIRGDFKRNFGIYAIALPGILYYLIFGYIPMYGIIIAFKDYSPGLGILGSPWVGFEHFISFFSSYYFTRVIRNTILLNLYLIVFGFPVPIILALSLNELRGKYLKKTVQSITYLPHFISSVIICGMIVDFTSSSGFITTIVNAFGGNYNNLLHKEEFFRTIYVASDIWQTFGWSSIIYLAAMSGLDTELYEAAMLDGANKFKQLIHITLPGIAPTIIIMFILRIGQVMSLGAEKVILLYNPVVYETADIISSYVYRKGLVESDYSFSTAVGMFNSLINCALIYISNLISRKFSETSLF